MKRFEIGVAMGFLAGWAVGTGRASLLWHRWRDRVPSVAPADPLARVHRPPAAWAPEARPDIGVAQIAGA